jgi:sterol desaturase/sphingolipid hydroxylase (fatty acid hydroxylase superfamily)
MTKILHFFEQAALTSANYWMGLVCDILWALVFLAAGLYRFNGSLPELLMAILFGFGCWGFLEYALHRWLLHGPLVLPRRGHAQHHVNATKLVSTPALIMGCMAFGFCTLLGRVIDPGLATLAVFGMYSGYNYFALLHHLQHHEPQTIARFSYFRALSRLHAVHHKNGSVNYGTTTLLWDRLLGTFQPDFSRTIRS